MIKTLFRKKGQAHVLFRSLRTSLESFLYLWSVIQYVYFPPFHFYELVVNFNHYELGLITSICACLGMTDFGTYNKSHGPARKNTDHPDVHHGWSVGWPRIVVFVQHCLLDICIGLYESKIYLEISIGTWLASDSANDHFCQHILCIFLLYCTGMDANNLESTLIQ